MSDESGSMEITNVAEGVVNKSLLDPSDVFLLDTGKTVFVWIGSGASSAETKNAMPYAHVSSKICYFHTPYTYTMLILIGSSIVLEFPLVPIIYSTLLACLFCY